MSQQFLNGTSAQERPLSAMKILQNNTMRISKTNNKKGTKMKVINASKKNLTTNNMIGQK